jgi:nucleotide-binding universal stress UspA family protein
MISHILVPMDDSEMAERALEYALENHPDAEITVLHVAGNPSLMGGTAAGLALEGDTNEAAEKAGEAVFDRARAVAAEHGVEVAAEVGMGHPARVILNRASDFDAVVIGSHSGSLTDRLFVGNVAKKVAHQSPVPVTVVR